MLVVAVAVPAAPAAAAEYPTWDDVAAVRNDEAATQARIADIQNLLVGLQAEVDRTVADAEAKAAVWNAADTKYQQAAARTDALQAQALEARNAAAASQQRAGRLAAQLVRGGQDPTARLLTDAGNADELLYGLGMLQKVAVQANSIYERALADQNTAQALTDQANVAERELDNIRIAAEAAFAQSREAAAAAGAALEEQRANQATLQQQLAVLSERRAATEADYLAGVRERIAADASLDAGEISPTGWARPVAGRISYIYGYSPEYGPNPHKGVDMRAGCGQNVFAAASGTVIVASEGWNGGYGNYIMVDNGGGIVTVYAHLIEGGVLVSPGQAVGVGQNIGRAGSSGISTGCHLHYEVRINGQITNPATFMLEQGIDLW